MRRSAFPMRAGFALGVLVVAVAGANAQEGGGLLPGTNGVQKPAGAVTTCSARNALATKQCTTTCSAGQTADCDDSDDGSDPTCVCSGG